MLFSIPAVLEKCRHHNLIYFHVAVEIEFTQELLPGERICLKARSHDPFLRIRFLLVPKNGSCEHIKNDLPSNGSLILKKRMEIQHALFHLTLSLKDERHRQILHDRFGAKLKILSQF